VAAQHHHNGEDGASIVTSSWDSAGQGDCAAQQPAQLHGISPVADSPTPDRYFIREAFSNTSPDNSVTAAALT